MKITATDRISDALGFGPVDEGAWSDKTTEFEAFNDAGLECEVGEFMYAMVRLLKPAHVLETGTHVGIGASYIGLGLSDNNKGHLDTIEFIPELHYQAADHLKKLNLKNYVTAHLMDIKDFKPTELYDLILLDTEPQTRFNEMVRFWDHLNEGGYLFIHDLSRHLAQIKVNNPDHPGEPYWPWGKLPNQIQALIRNGEAKPFYFDNPRGFTGFYKENPNDYDWRAA